MKERQKIILFGASKLGEEAFNSLKKENEILFFCDNNENKWGKYFLSKKILSPNELRNYQDCLVVISSMYYEEIAKQLNFIENINYKIYKPQYLNVPVELTNLFSNKLVYNKKSNSNIILNYENVQIKKILFVETTQFEETEKLCKILKNNNIQVDLLLIDDGYVKENKRELFNNIIYLNNLKSQITINKLKEYDLIHFSNENNDIRKLLERINKPIINFVNNMDSIKKGIFNDKSIINYLENKLNNAINNRLFIDRYNLFRNNIEEMDRSISFGIVFDLLENEIPLIQVEKISAQDREIHCAILEDVMNGVKMQAKILKIMERKIHVHFFVKKNRIINELKLKSHYFHIEYYENDVELLEKLAAYDLGLILYDKWSYESFFYSNTLPESFYKFYASNIPIATEDLTIFKELFNYYNIGNIIDFGQDIYEQIIKISKINYTNNKIYELTLDNEYMKILDFYKKAIADFYEPITNKDDDYIKESTIIIPTHNRHILLKRIISYYNLFDTQQLKVNLIILDSSNDEIKKKNKKLCEIKKFTIKILYYELDNNISFFEKLLYGVEKVKTEACCICADDDFLTEEGIIKSIEFLEKNKDYITVKGETYRFYDNEFYKCNRIVGQSSACNNLNDEEPVKRLLRFVEKNNFYTLIYLCFNTELLKKAIKKAINNEYFNLLNIRFANSLFYFMVVLSGKVHRIEQTISLREDSKSSGTYYLPNFHDSVLDGSFNNNVKFLNRILSNVLSKNQLEELKIYNFIEKYLVNTINVDEKYFNLIEENFDLELLKKGFIEAGWIK